MPPLVQQSSEQLVLLIRRTTSEFDADNFHDVFRKYSARLRIALRARMDPRLLRRIGLDDIIQTAWVEVIRRGPAFWGTEERTNYLNLRTIAFQKLIDCRKYHFASKRTPRREVYLEWGGIEESGCAGSFLMEGTPHGVDPVKGIGCLSLDGVRSQDREMLILRYQEGLSLKEIAQRLRISQAATRQRHRRALKLLRRRLRPS